MSKTTTDLSLLKINTLKSEEQYKRALTDGRINENEIYLVPDETEAALDEIIQIQDTLIQNGMTNPDSMWLVNMIYPIGSIYMSVNDINPDLIFGGTWERIQGRFLLGAGPNEANNNDYLGELIAGEVNRPLGEKAGTEDVQLTIDQIPSHNHNPYLDSFGTDSFGEKVNPNGSGYWGVAPAGGYTSGYRSGTIQTTYTGGNGWHNNMPPYLAVNMWKRTA